MEGLRDELRKLSNQEIREKLQNLGETVGPIVDSTRPLFEKKIIRLILGNNESDTSGDKNSYLNCEVARTKAEDNESYRAQAGDAKPNFELRSENEVPLSKPTPSQYYGVLLPEDLNGEDVPDGSTVFSDKTEALKFAKKYKGARFKVFKTAEEAMGFTQLKDTSICSSPAPTLPGSPQRPPPEIVVNVSPVGTATESLPFKAPKMPELVKLRRTIESNNTEEFKSYVWGNPRYLISSGDTPVILQEGFRYNALHVAAQRNKPDMCRLALDTIQDPAFVELLYEHDNEKTRTDRIEFLLDLYLNTPDKGNCETPLHFASKFGHAEVVEILTSYPSTDKHRKNKYGETPLEVVCSRIRDKTNEAAIRSKIESCLQERYYVPLLRSDDNTSQPVILDPWSPDAPRANEVVSPFDSPKPENPKDPVRSVKAYAGPMSPAKAELFHRTWHTPPASEKRKYHNIRLADSEKGLERIGRTLAHNLDVPWTEYWGFLQCHIDLTTEQGLKKLEAYLKEKTENVTRIQEEGDDSFDLNVNVSNSNKEPVNLYNDNFQTPRRPIREIKLGSKDSPINLDDSKDFNKALDKISESLARLDLNKSLPSPEIAEKSTEKIGEKDEIVDDKNTNFSPKMKLFTKNNEDSNSSFDEPDAGTEQQTNSPSSEQSSVYSSNSESSPSRMSRLFGMLWGAATYIPRKMFVRNSPQVSEDELDNKVNEQTVEEKPTKQHTSTPGKIPAYKLLKPVFIEGGCPSKLDVDVYRALENTEVDPDMYPHIARWKDKIEDCSEQMRNSWPSPAATRMARRRRQTLSQSAPAKAVTSRLLASEEEAFGSPSLPSRSQMKTGYSGDGAGQENITGQDTTVETNLMKEFLIET